MPVIKIHGENVHYSEQEAGQRLHDLRERNRALAEHGPKAGVWTSEEHEELVGLEAYHERWQYARRRSGEAMARDDGGIPGSAEEDERWQDVRRRVDWTEAELEAMARRQMGLPGQSEGIDNSRAGFGGGGQQPTERGGWLTAPGEEQRLAPVRRSAMQTIEQYQRSSVLASRAADVIDGVLRTGDPDALTARYLTAVGNPHYGTAFGRMLADPQMAHLRYSPEEVEAVREADWALKAASRAVLTTGTTGVPLPLTIDPSIILSGSGALNPVRQLATVTVVGTHDWLGVSSDGVTAAYVQEGVEATDATPVLAAPRISTQQGRAFCQLTIEASQDWAASQQELVGLINDARSVLDATKFLSGSGTNEPSGILNIGGTNGLTTTQRVQTTTVATYAVGDPWLLKAAIPARFLPSTTFAAAPGTFDTTYRFVGGNSTEPFQFANGDRGGNFLGRPKVEWSTMGTGSTTGTKLIIGGDFRTGYRIVDRLGMTAEVIPHMLGTNRLPLGVRGIYVYWRTGAGVVAVNAFRYLEVK
jgi:HK97 family phage major capsid protein